MAFSSNEFKGAFKKGFARPNKFRIKIYPRSAGLVSTVGGQLLSIACTKTVMPGSSFFTTDQFMYGVRQQMPYGRSYGNITLTFLCDADMLVRRTFDNWRNFICNPRSNYFNYYDNYIADLEIMQFNDFGFLAYRQQCREVYPLTVGDVELDHGANNQIGTFDVVFAVKDILNDDARAASGDSGINDNGGFDLQTGPGVPGGDFDPGSVKPPGAGGGIFDIFNDIPSFKDLFGL